MSEVKYNSVLIQLHFSTYWNSVWIEHIDTGPAVMITTYIRDDQFVFCQGYWLYCLSCFRSECQDSLLNPYFLPHQISAVEIESLNNVRSTQSIG
jgi:hypothetical protein